MFSQNQGFSGLLKEVDIDDKNFRVFKRKCPDYLKNPWRYYFSR